MKKKLSFIVIVTMLAATSFAQNIRLNGYAMGVFNDKVDSYYDNTSYYNGTINGGFQWGTGLEFMVRKDYGVELLYLRQDTKAPITYYDNGVKNTDFDLGINYIMLGGTRYFRGAGKVEGFGGAMLGIDAIGIDNPDNGKHSSKTFFAWGIRGGANIWASEKVGIKLQAQLLSAVQSVGGGFYFGTGGAGAGVASYSSMYQFGLGGGLVFKLGGAAKK
jgi:hypothetical protein